MRASLVRRRRRGGGGAGNLARNVDASLEAVEEISRRAARYFPARRRRDRPEIGDVAVAELFRQLEIEFAPMARAKGLKLTFVGASLDTCAPTGG